MSHSWQRQSDCKYIICGDIMWNNLNKYMKDVKEEFLRVFFFLKSFQKISSHFPKAYSIHPSSKATSVYPVQAKIYREEATTWQGELASRVTGLTYQSQSTEWGGLWPTHSFTAHNTRKWSLWDTVDPFAEFWYTEFSPNIGRVLSYPKNEYRLFKTYC